MKISVDDYGELNNSQKLQWQHTYIVNSITLFKLTLPVLSFVSFMLHFYTIISTCEKELKVHLFFVFFLVWVKKMYSVTDKV